MQESPFYERIVERSFKQGIEQGARQTRIESTLNILNERFSNADIKPIRTALEAITDLNRLKTLNLTASIAASFHAFQEELET